jgi:hypothetical protein
MKGIADFMFSAAHSHSTNPQNHHRILVAASFKPGIPVPGPQAASATEQTREEHSAHCKRWRRG